MSKVECQARRGREPEPFRLIVYSFQWRLALRLRLAKLLHLSLPPFVRPQIGVSSPCDFFVYAGLIFIK